MAGDTNVSYYSLSASGGSVITSSELEGAAVTGGESSSLVVSDYFSGNGIVFTCKKI